MEELSSYKRARVVCEEDPPPPSLSARDHASTEEATPCPARLIRGDLDTIVAMALRKYPDRRYASVEQLAQDVRRHLDGRPVIARRDTVAYRVTKFTRRNKAGVLASVAVLLALIGGVTTTGLALREARREQAAAKVVNDVP